MLFFCVLQVGMLALIEGSGFYQEPIIPMMCRELTSKILEVAAIGGGTGLG